MKLGQLVTPEFQKSLKSLLESNLPITTAFKLRGVAKVIADEHAKYDELRIELLKEYADKKEDGELDVDTKSGMVKFTGDNSTQFATKLTELTNIEVDVPQIQMKELEGLESFTAKDLLHLGELIGE